MWSEELIHKRGRRVECVTQSEDMEHWLVNKGVLVVLQSVEASVSVACGGLL